MATSNHSFNIAESSNRHRIQPLLQRDIQLVIHHSYAPTWTRDSSRTRDILQEQGFYVADPTSYQKTSSTVYIDLFNSNSFRLFNLQREMLHYRPKLNIQEFIFFRVAFLSKEISDNNNFCVREHTATIGVNGLFNRLQGTVKAP